MNTLQQAQQGLQFEDIFQRYTQSSLLDDFDPKFSGIEDTLSAQFKHSVVQSLVVTLKKESETLEIFRVQIDVGIRFLVENNEQEAKPVAQIEASYLVDYVITDTALLGATEALDEFALKNASYHLWPFWREFVMSQAQRMNLPKVPLPMRLPAKS